MKISAKFSTLPQLVSKNFQQKHTKTFIITPSLIQTITIALYPKDIISGLIQEILPTTWSVAFKQWEAEYIKEKNKRGFPAPKKFQNGNKAIYAQMFKSNVYTHIFRMYDKYRSYPLINNIQCKSILACLAKESTKTLTPEIVRQKYAAANIEEKDFESLKTDYMKELLRSSGATHLTVFEILLVFYVHWLLSTSKRIGKFDFTLSKHYKSNFYPKIDKSSFFHFARI